MRRAHRIPWEQWHRMVTMRSLQMMVMSGVVRRADLDPPQVFVTAAREAGEDQAEQSLAEGTGRRHWFARMRDWRTRATSPGKATTWQGTTKL